LGLTYSLTISNHRSGEDRRDSDSGESNTAVVTQETSDCGTHTITTDPHYPTSSEWDEGSSIPDGISEPGIGSHKNSGAVEEPKYNPKPVSEMEGNGKVIGVNVT
jgi:hypothetical protein